MKIENCVVVVVLLFFPLVYSLIMPVTAKPRAPPRVQRQQAQSRRVAVGRGFAAVIAVATAVAGSQRSEATDYKRPCVSMPTACASARKNKDAE